MRRALLVALAGAAVAGCAPPCAVDHGIDGPTCATVQAMALPVALPGDPSNGKAEDYQAAVLGFHIFFDARFSAGAKVHCATCHAPERHFADGLPVAMGLSAGTRNAPTTLNAAHETRFFWDGRADALWVPPLLAMENPLEMDFTRLELAHLMAAAYADSYTAIFGALPPLDDATRFPARGKPGDAAFDQMAPDDQDAVDRVAANVGKSLEAYLRMQASKQSPFDRFLGGVHGAITPHQELGMLLFVQSGCARCHSGPLLSDGKFHNLGVAAAAGAEPDRGRAAAVDVERAQTFSPAGRYSDLPTPLDLAPAVAADEGAFRTPSLRNVAVSAPYMHNGSLATLDDAVAFHLRGGGRGQSGYVGQVDSLLEPVTLSDSDRAALVDFLTTLTGDPANPPWNDWQDKP
jgi:cytochrome c peroxidase